MSPRDIDAPQGGPTGRDYREGKPSLRDSGERVRGRKAWERGFKARSYRLQGPFEAKKLQRRG